MEVALKKLDPEAELPAHLKTEPPHAGPPIHVGIANRDARWAGDPVGCAHGRLCGKCASEV